MYGLQALQPTTAKCKLSNEQVNQLNQGCIKVEVDLDCQKAQRALYYKERSQMLKGQLPPLTGQDNSWTWLNGKI